MFAYLIWDPDRNLLILPYLNHPVTWYGFLFATGFLLGYYLVRNQLAANLQTPQRSKDECLVDATFFTDRLAFFIVIGGILGARLGHILFYDWSYYRHHLNDIFKIWEGGLASHGGAIGALIGLFVFVLMTHKKAPQLSFLSVLDTLTIPTALTASLIRIGNFMNQEITGLPTNLPWGVIFKHPVDGIAEVPLHPVQIYEAIFYFVTFVFLFLIRKRTKDFSGLLSGLFFLLIFVFRFLIEFLKMPQNLAVDMNGWLTMGQWLSLPFIFLGTFLLLRRNHVIKKAR